MARFNFGTGVLQDGAERKRGIERVASLCLLALIFLLPVFFMPAVSFPFQFSKAIFLSIGVLVVFCIWVIARLRDGRFVIPSSPILMSLFVVVALSALSGLLSGTVGSSILGQGFEVGTTFNILIVALMAFLVPIVFSAKEQIFGGYLAFIASFLIIALFHVLRLLFGADFLALGLFTDMVSNTIGKWNDLGVFFGVSALLSVITIELLTLSRMFKAIIYLSLVVSLFLLAIVNFAVVWFVLGLFSLVFIVYLLSFNTPQSQAVEGDAAVSGNPSRLRRIPLPSLMVLIISVIFILAGNTIGTGIANKLQISQIEARPSWAATFDVARQTLQKDPLLGAGPNQFASEWLKYKPDGINETIFWDVDFDYGVGLIPTFLATTGVLGALAWVAFFLIFLFYGFKAILSKVSDTFSQYLITSSFLVSLFLWIFSIFYIPSLTIFAITFLFTGLFIASLMIERLAPAKTILFGSNPRAGFVSVLLLILMLIGGVTLGYFLVQKYAAAVLFQRGVIAYNTDGNVDKAEGNIVRAATMSPTDIYYRFLTELSLIRMNTLLNQNPTGVSAESVRAEFQTLLGNALGNARQAVALNPSNYQNLMSLGRVYEAVTPLNIEGSYEGAKESYDKALALNPKSPAIHLTLARLEVAHKDNPKARENIALALKEKSNYTEAIFLLSQIEIQEGNIKAAIKSVEAASVIAPDDASVFFQLGFLRFNDKDYTGAASALERAVTLNPTYANAKYFLGLSYEKLRLLPQAIKQFTDLAASNPDNEEVKLILANLTAGKEPFESAQPPVDTAPEKRSTLPVPEKDTKGVVEE